MNGRKVVITGLGAVSSLGLSVAELWAGLCSGRCGIRQISAFDPAGFTCTIAGQAPDYRIQDYVPKSHRKAVKLMCRDIELAIIAAKEAFGDAGIKTKADAPDKSSVVPERTAINLAAGLISADLDELAMPVAECATDGRFDIHKWGSRGMEMLTPLWLLKYLPNMLACHISIIHDIQGPSNSITCGEAGGIIAVSEAANVIARNAADTALAGGCEAKVNPIVLLRQCLLKRATSAGNDNPESACRPFDADAAGAVFGEGAAIIVLEELQQAKKRNAKIYAQIAGFGSSNSINPEYEHLEPDGRGITIAIEQAIAHAQISPQDIDLIIPHGTGIAADDMAEAKGIRNALGNAAAEISVWPIKSMIGNTGAASGAMNVLVAAKAISQSKIGPARNFTQKAGACNLNISTSLQNKTIRYALCCSYSFGGQISAIVLKNINGEI